MKYTQMLQNMSKCAASISRPTRLTFGKFSCAAYTSGDYFFDQRSRTMPQLVWTKYILNELSMCVVRRAGERKSNVWWGKISCQCLLCEDHVLLSENQIFQKSVLLSENKVFKNACFDFGKSDFLENAVVHSDNQFFNACLALGKSDFLEKTCFALGKSDFLKIRQFVKYFQNRCEIYQQLWARCELYQ